MARMSLHPWCVTTPLPAWVIPPALCAPFSTGGGPKTRCLPPYFSRAPTPGMFPRGIVPPSPRVLKGLRCEPSFPPGGCYPPGTVPPPCVFPSLARVSPAHPGEPPHTRAAPKFIISRPQEGGPRTFVQPPPRGFPSGENIILTPPEVLPRFSPTWCAPKGANNRRVNPAHPLYPIPNLARAPAPGPWPGLSTPVSFLGTRELLRQLGPLKGPRPWTPNGPNFGPGFRTNGETPFFQLPSSFPKSFFPFGINFALPNPPEDPANPGRASTPGSRPRPFKRSPRRPSYSSEHHHARTPLPRRSGIGPTLQRHPFSGLVDSAGELLHTP